MPRRFRQILAPLLAVPLSGCAILSLGQGGHEGGTATLSDAAAVARRDTTRAPSQPLEAGIRTPPTSEIVVGTEAPPPDIAPAGDAPVPVPRAPRPVQHEHFLAGAVIGGGALGGSGYDGFTTFGLAFGGYPSPRVRVDGVVTASDVRFTGESLMGQSFRNAADLSLDVTVRFYLTEEHTFLGLYPMAGVGTGTVFWDYASAVPIFDDGVLRMAEDDRINHFSLFGGAGLSLVQTRHLHLGGSLVGGVRFYGRHTDNQFRNDMLPTTGFARLLLDLSYHWDHAY